MSPVMGSQLPPMIPVTKSGYDVMQRFRSSHFDDFRKDATRYGTIFPIADRYDANR